MEENYRVIRSTYKTNTGSEKQSFMVMSVQEGKIDHRYECSYVESDSLEGIKNTLNSMIASLSKPIMEEKRELVEI